MGYQLPLLENCCWLAAANSYHFTLMTYSILYKQDTYLHPYGSAVYLIHHSQPGDTPNGLIPQLVEYLYPYVL